MISVVLTPYRLLTRSYASRAFGAISALTWMRGNVEAGALPESVGMLRPVGGIEGSGTNRCTAQGRHGPEFGEWGARVDMIRAWRGEARSGYGQRVRGRSSARVRQRCLCPACALVCAFVLYVFGIRME